MHGYEALVRWVDLRNSLFPHDPDSVQVLALARAREAGHVNLIAYVDDEPVGVAMIGDDPGTQASTHAYVEVGIVPSFRGRGIGTALFRDVFNVPIALSVAVTRTVNVQAEFYPKNRDFTELPATATAPPRRTSAGWIVAFEKTVLRHRFSWTVGNLRATSVDQYAGSDFAGGLPRDDVFIGFNLVRQWKLK